MEIVKTSSSKWIKTKGPEFARFHWQGGYGAFSVSQSDADAVVRYIDNQEAHHRRLSFQDEFRTFLERYQVAYDERYVGIDARHYAALAGLMHGGTWQARWAGLKCRAVGALEQPKGPLIPQPKTSPWGCEKRDTFYRYLFASTEDMLQYQHDTSTNPHSRAGQP